MSDASTDRERERIAVGRRIDWETEGDLGTVRFGPGPDGFDPLPVETARQLVDRGYLDPASRQNDSPTAESFLEFAARLAEEYPEERPTVGLIGYMVAPDREDSRIAIAGLVVETRGPMTETLQREVARWARSADYFAVDEDVLRATWD